MQKHGHLTRKRGDGVAEGIPVGRGVSDAGFTLMELMIALMIISFGIMGVWSMQAAAISGNIVSRKITEASVAGSDQLEKLMLMGYDDGDLTYDADIHTPLVTDSGTVVTWRTPPSGGDYSIQMTVSVDDPISNVKKIDVAVSWERAGQAKELSYVYYKGAFTAADAS